MLKSWLINLSRPKKRLILLSFDMLAIWLCLIGSLFLRLGSLNWLTDYSPTALWQLFTVPLFCCLPFFIRMGLYRAVVRMINTSAFITIIRACAFSTISFIVIDAMLLKALTVPRSVPLLFFTLLSITMLASRYFVNKWLLGDSLSNTFGNLLKTKSYSQSPKGKPALVYGDKNSVVELIRQLDRTSHYHLAAVICSNPFYSGGEIDNRPIYSVNQINHAINKHQPKLILLALPEAPHNQKAELIAELEQFHLPIKTVPDYASLLSGRQLLSDIRPINVLDILQREEAAPNPDLLASKITGRVVCITGAGGSIGSEIALQAFALKPAKLMIIDHSEYALFTLEQKLKSIQGRLSDSITIIPCLLSVLGEATLLSLFEQHQPDTVYHAAAYKHVPLLESNYMSAINNNITGTLITVQCAIKAKIKDFTLISTDKAVRPTSVMGATKRVTELLLQALASEVNFTPFYYYPESENTLGQTLNNLTTLSIVRFGNVLGSSGSVIPTFTTQIKNGGPLTVTHPDVTRYFMSIPEAAQLVIQASAMANTGDLFLLDMGQPIKIRELAEQMIKLAGFNLKTAQCPDGDIGIEYSGLRPGEKLFEELLIEDNAMPTVHQKIFTVREPYKDWISLTRSLDQLFLKMSAGDDSLSNQLFSILDTDSIEYGRTEAVA